MNSFVLTLPEGWIEIPPDPDELVATISDRIASAHPDALEDIDVRRSLFLLRRLAARAQQAGLALSAATLESIDEGKTEEDDSVYFLIAIAWLAVLPAEHFGVPVVTFGQLRAAVDQSRGDAQIERLHDPVVVDLPGGPAMRDTSLSRRPIGDGTQDQVSILDVRYHTIVGEGEGMAVLGFTTPNVELADELGELFEAIAQTLEFVAV
jgi:hypothetical protein